MASSILIFILIFSIYPRRASSLQVTPNSPCSSLCIDSNDLDISDPNSSNTANGDITCYDKDFNATATGRKFQSCMTCLQDSTFSQGQETDQAWFLYNLRYTLDYCIFGFPNATNIASTPCSTSTACGELEGALTDDDLDATNLQAYGYCSADGGALTDSAVAQCKACVAASDGQDYMANFLVALEAACQQKPAAGTLVGLDGTVFSTTEISIKDPSASGDDSDSQSALSTPTIVGIAIGVVAVLLAVAGFLFVRLRKRRNRRVRLGGPSTTSSAKRGKHRPASSLSFRCQTHLSPRSPTFFSGPSETAGQDEKRFASPIHTTNPNTFASETTSSKWSGWEPKPAAESGHGSRRTGPSLPLYNITTAAPTVPSGVYYSTSPKSKSFSPIDDMTTPASTTSTKSTSQLLPLRPYNPAEYGISAPQMGTVPETTYPSPISGSTASPLISRAWDQRNPVWDSPLPARSTSKSAIAKVNVLGGSKGRRMGSGTGSPIESREINTKFPAPPSPKRFGRE
ncbi:hypothetical protein PFICI_09631 [Pestalotiopsis fici W106-1]|uniref:LPXTG-domain-containing protein n=1 Tax=Pestalotiopsis fici (strain W106-1 / CGMCC3.15140) TaxID=1229662 RepID=W3X0Y9_PESFW|nr:uncharacterized protein PFICI_09631 [Pestalotiopsis fici W106-1]ETS79778.1 hypothetical protein PFICI_09631 [Pestalotiopsis fici W106-1]